MCALLAYRLLQKLSVVVDIQHPHVLCHDGGGGHPPEAAVLPGRKLPAHPLAACHLSPQMVQAGVSVLEVRERKMVCLQQILAPNDEGKGGLGGRLGHLPVLGLGQVQRIVDGAVEGFDQHVWRICILLAEVDPRHLPEASDRATHRGDPQQAELHIHIAEGLRAAGREAEVGAAPQLPREPEELRAHEEPAFEDGLQRSQQLLRIEPEGVVRRPCQDHLNLTAASQNVLSEHRNVIHALLLDPAADEDEDLGARVLIQIAVLLQGRLGFEAHLPQLVDACGSLVLRRVGGIVQRQDVRQAPEEHALALQICGVVGRDRANSLTTLHLLDVGNTCLEHVEAPLEHQVFPDGSDFQVEDQTKASHGGRGLPEAVVDEVRLDDPHIVRIVEDQDHWQWLLLQVERRQGRVVVHAVVDVWVQHPQESCHGLVPKGKVA
mmetsp:Transcript_75800/g.181265  ORF Transcript_75800/g.181265 Transcript_75800/m.181265 type:complete len:435 (-) Transcript_75800:4983-6287(-)